MSNKYVYMYYKIVHQTEPNNLNTKRFFHDLDECLALNLSIFAFKPSSRFLIVLCSVSLSFSFLLSSCILEEGKCWHPLL